MIVNNIFVEDGEIDEVFDKYAGKFNRVFSEIDRKVDKDVKNFSHFVFYRRDKSQYKADKLWSEIKPYIDDKKLRDFETEWHHYINGEISAKEFSYYFSLIKIDIKKAFIDRKVSLFASAFRKGLKTYK